MNLPPLQTAEQFVAAREAPPRLSAHETSVAAELAAAIAAADPDRRLEVFADWDVVDAARASLHTGLAHRVGVHHRDAFLCASVQAALRTCGAIVLHLS